MTMTAIDIGLQLDPKQAEAVALCCDMAQRLAGVDGPAGAGKTTIMRAVYRALQNAGYSIVMTAPTGKAAKRIQEATGIPAMTMHRLLEFSSPGEPDEKTGKPLFESIPKRNHDNPINYDVVLADEYTMTNEQLHRDLMAGARRSVIRVFGDLAQLPPIEPDKRNRDKPSPFKQILDNPKIPTVTLETIHRQAEGSGILHNANRIRVGKMPGRNHEDFKLHITDFPVNALMEWLDEIEENGPVFNSIRAQIISPQKKRRGASTAVLNPRLQKRYIAPDAEFTVLPRHKWDEDAGLELFVGDKVIMDKNYYDLRSEHEKYDDNGDPLPVSPQDAIFNGETGVVTHIDEDECFTIDLGDRSVTIPPSITYSDAEGNVREIDPRKDVMLAYAITTHKAQGSEFDRIVYMMHKSTSFMQVRSNFYTAVTRAKKQVDIFTDARSLSSAVFKVK